MGIHADVRALAVRGDLNDDQKRAQKATLVAADLTPRLLIAPKSLSRGKVALTFATATVSTGPLAAIVDFRGVQATWSGVAVPLDPNQRIVNPPIRVDDPAGTIVEGPTGSERRTREAPLEALTTALLDTVESQLRGQGLR